MSDPTRHDLLEKIKVLGWSMSDPTDPVNEEVAALRERNPDAVTWLDLKVENDKLKKRIERLQEDLANESSKTQGLEDENTQLKQGYTAIRNDMSRLSRESKTRIEELKQWREEDAETIANLAREIVEKKDRTEELERWLEECTADRANLSLALTVLEDSHHFTHDQIKAAWKRGVEEFSLGGSSYFEALEEFGIKRCGVCHSETNMEWRRRGEGGILCSTCNGDGFVIGDSQ